MENFKTKYWKYIERWGVDEHGYFDEIECCHSENDEEDDMNYISKGGSEGLDVYTNTLPEVINYYKNHVRSDFYNLCDFNWESIEEKEYIKKELFGIK